MVGLVRELVGVGFGAVVVVDDGSGDGFAGVFAAVEDLGGVRVVRHGGNRGKGRALKTGFSYVLAELPEVVGVVTADADGQHRVGDVARVGVELVAGDPTRDGETVTDGAPGRLGQAKGRVVLGVRTRLGEGPWRSRVGNAVVRRVFGWVTGVRLRDTQTGLRGFSRGMLAELVGMTGERYEFEMAVLAEVCKRGRPVEVEIETVYEEGNRGSHFRAVRDSVRVLWVLVREGRDKGEGRRES
jgi:glycosyltransferase involved in cell wall biosynthesis